MTGMLERPTAMARRRAATALVAFACLLALPAGALAALGQPDPGYGTGGLAVVAGTGMTVQDGVVDGAGRVVVAGTAGGPPAPARPAGGGGGPDTTFANGAGYVVLDRSADIVSVAIDAGGHLVLAGSAG